MTDPVVEHGIPKGIIITLLAGCILALAAAPAVAQGGGWQFQTPSFDLSLNWLTDVSALDANHVWVIGPPYYGGTPCVLRSADGGATWAETCSSDFGNGTLRIRMASPTVGYIGGYGPYTSNWNGIVRRTTDGGATWASDNGFVPNGVIYGLTAPDADHVWTAGNLNAGNLGVIYHRLPGTPPTWAKEWTSSSIASLFGISAVDVTTAWAVGSGGLILKTVDSGAHWVAQTPPSGSGYGSSTYFMDVAAIDVNTAWILAEDYVFRTTDGGATWPLKLQSNSASLKRIVALNGNVAWVVGSDGNGRPAIYHTSDGGATWAQQPAGTSSRLNGIAAVDANNAWIAADYGIILHTTDGGTGKWVAPTVTSVTPNHGPSTGDQDLTITGTAFRYPVTVTIGSTTVTQGSYLTFVNGTTIQLTFYGYGQPPGTYDVTVTNGDLQTGTLAGGFTTDAAPGVTSVSPSYGSIVGGYQITVHGTNFVSGAQVFLQGVYGYPQPTTFVDSSTLLVTVGNTQPDGSAWLPGVVNVTVQNPDLQYTLLNSAFTLADPSVFQFMAITPTSGSTLGGTPVTISGFGFGSGVSVAFGGAAAAGVVVVNPTTITAVTPAHAAGAVNVTGQLNAAQTTLSGFTYVTTPTVTSILPRSGPVSGGLAVTITGTGFASGATVTIGGVGATNVTVVNSTTITATTPTHAANVVDVVVTNPGGLPATLAGGFTYYSLLVFTSTTATAGPVALAIDTGGNKYVADNIDGKVLKFAPDGTMTTVATLDPLGGLAVSASGTIYVSEPGDHRIRQIVGGTVTTLAGGTQGNADGNGTAAQFNHPMGLFLTPNGLLFVADRDNHRIRRIDTSSGDVITVAGSTQGYADAVGTAAQFNAPRSLAQDPLQNLYVADTGNSVIRRITKDGVVTTYAGSTPGFADGVGAAAQFLNPQGVMTDFAGWVHVADTGNNRIRMIAPGGTVTTMAGNGVAGYNDGDAASAQFMGPRGLWIAGHGAVYVADFGNNVVRKIGSPAAYPTITGVTPTSGPTAGGTSITITGTGFVAGATVVIGGAQGIGVTVVNDTTITVTSAARDRGVMTVAVRNPDGLMFYLSPGFAYYDAPATIQLSGLNQTFNGTPRPVTVTTTPEGLPVGVWYAGAGTTYYAGSWTAPTNAGTYSVTANLDDGSHCAFATGLLTITLPPSIPVDFGGSGHSNLAVFRGSTGQWWVYGLSDPITFAQAGDIPVVADYNGDGKADLAVYRPSTSEWIIQGQSPVVFGQVGDVPVPGDYNGDGITEIAVFHPASGDWTIQGQSGSVHWGQRGDIPVPADYNGDGITEIAVFRPTTGTWYVMNGTTLQWGMWGDVPVPGDYSGVGHAQIAIYRPSTGWWYVASGPMAQWGEPGDVPVLLDVDGDARIEFVVFRPDDGTWYAFDPVSMTVLGSLAWGESGDTPVGQPPQLPAGPVLKTAGDFDHDGAADVTVFRPSTGGWYTLQSTHAYHTYVGVTLGQDGDIPVPGDYQGTGSQERAVYRPSTGQWLLEDGRTFGLGAPGDVPVPADYDGDGITDIAVFQPSSSLWSILTGASGFTTLQTMTWGQAGDVPAPGDYDGDGKTDLAVFTPATGQWTIRSSVTGTTLVTVPFGMSGDIPVPGDYDGDGKTDIAVYRLGTGYWYVLTSSSNWSNYQWYWWGAVDDVPVPGDFDGDGITDVAVYRPSTGTWYVMNVLTITGWGEAADIPIFKRQP